MASLSGGSGNYNWTEGGRRADWQPPAPLPRRQNSQVAAAWQYIKAMMEGRTGLPDNDAGFAPPSVSDFGMEPGSIIGGWAEPPEFRRFEDGSAVLQAPGNPQATYGSFHDPVAAGRFKNILDLLMSKKRSQQQPSAPAAPQVFMPGVTLASLLKKKQVEQVLAGSFRKPGVIYEEDAAWNPATMGNKRGWVPGMPHNQWTPPPSQRDKASQAQRGGRRSF